MLSYEVSKKTLDKLYTQMTCELMDISLLLGGQFDAVFDNMLCSRFPIQLRRTFSNSVSLNIDWVIENFLKV